MSKTLKIALASMFAFAFVLTANASAPATNFARNMMTGTTGADVKELQMFLNACPDTALAVTAGSAGSAGYETMTFGPATKAAVMKYQTKVGVISTGNFYTLTRGQASTVGNVCGGAAAGTFAPAGCTAATGFSPVTGGACYAVAAGNFPAGCTSNVGYSPTTGMSCSGGAAPAGTLTGEGTVKDFAVATAEESDFAEGDSKAELVAFDVELEDDGALKMDRFDLYMGQDNSVTASNDPWDYFTKAYLMVNGTTVASMDVDSEADWAEYDTGTLATTSQEYRLRFSGLNVILANDETSKVTVAFDIASNLDSGDEDAVWQFGTTTDSFRFVDGTGYVFTDGEDLADSFGADTQDMADIDLTEAASSPDASVIEIGTSQDTNGVTLYKFNIEENNDVGVNIEEISMTFTTGATAGQADESEVIKKAYLYDGATLLGSESVAAGGAVTFDNLDLDVDGEGEKTITVKVDLDDVAAGVTEGTDIKVGSVDVITFEDDNGNDEGDISVTATGNSATFELRSTGIQVAFVSVTNSAVNVAQVENQTDNATTTLIFDVTAFGADIYVDGTVTEDGDGTYAAGQGVSYYITRADTGADAASLTTPAASLTTNADSEANTTWKVVKGTTERFTFTVNVANRLTDDAANDALLFQTAIKSIGWDTTAIAATTKNYTFNLDDFKNTPVLLGELDAA